MQTPTPPTRPTPPTPPSMKNSSTTLTTNTPSPGTMPAKEQPSATTSNIAQSPPNVPPFASYNNANSTSQETSSKVLSPTTQLPQNTPSSPSFSFFFILLLMIALSLAAVHWWKNYKPHRKTRIDYSSESSDDIVNLIFSERTPESVQAIPPQKPNKAHPTPEKKPKTKGNFEVRV